MNELILFSLIFAYITNWKRAKLIHKAIINPKKNLRMYPPTNLTRELSQKLNLNFKIKIQNDKIINGYMPGIPIKPVMVLTEGAIEKLTEDELIFLILHEIGHCINWHTLKDVVLWITFFSLGLTLTHLLILTTLETLIFSLLMGLLWIQMERQHEIAADNFALEHGAEPEAMISFFEKMNRQYKSIFTHNRILSLLFNSHPYVKDRIKMAEAYK